MFSRPCICYESVATSELIKSNSGWIIRRNEDSLEKILIRISSYNKKILREYGKNARKIYLKKFTNSIMYRNYQFLFWAFFLIKRVKAPANCVEFIDASLLAIQRPIPKGK